MTYDLIEPLVDEDSTLNVKQTNSCVEDTQEVCTFRYTLIKTDINDVVYSSTNNISGNESRNGKLSSDMYDKIGENVVDICCQEIPNWGNNFMLTVFYNSKQDDPTCVARYIIRRKESIDQENTVEYVDYIIDVHVVYPTFWEKYFGWIFGSSTKVPTETTFEEIISSVDSEPTKTPKKRSCSVF